MTEQEALEKAKAIIRAEHAAYMREWRKRNPDKRKEYRKNREQREAQKMIEGVKTNE